MEGAALAPFEAPALDCAAGLAPLGGGTSLRRLSPRWPM